MFVRLLKFEDVFLKLDICYFVEFVCFSTIFRVVDGGFVGFPCFLCFPKDLCFRHIFCIFVPGVVLVFPKMFEVSGLIVLQERKSMLGHSNFDLFTQSDPSFCWSR